MRIKTNTLKVILLSFLLCLSFNNIKAQEFQKVKPEDLGLSSERLKKISTLFQGYVDRKEIAGVITFVARKGKAAHFETYGYLDIKAENIMKHNSIFRIASMSKVFTSVAVMILYEEGHFSLSDPVSKFIPEFKNMKVAVNIDVFPVETEPAKTEITIRDLLRHTAGFTYSHYYSNLDKMYHDAGVDTRVTEPWNSSLSDFVKQLSKLPLAFNPGTNWEYSYSTDVLGYLIEIISSRPLDQFIKSRILEPLKLNDTGFTISKDKTGRFSNLYRFKDGKLILIDSSETSEYRQTPAALSGGGGWTNSGYGGLLSTATDFARILQMLLNNGELDGIRLLGRKTVELMLQNHLSGIPNGWLGSGVGFGLTSAVLTDTEKFGEAGSKGQIWWAGSCNTYFFIDPKEEMIGIMMTQIYPFGHLDLMGKFRLLALMSIID